MIKLEGVEIVAQEGMGFAKIHSMIPKDMLTDWAKLGYEHNFGGFEYSY